jgi:hypothetical protein
MIRACVSRSQRTTELEALKQKYEEVVDTDEGRSLGPDGMSRCPTAAETPISPKPVRVGRAPLRLFPAGSLAALASGEPVVIIVDPIIETRLGPGRTRR